ncbi:hypothetical protein NP233_g2328 [Leucocoprinus birnbaumii]|uniref:Uncharacterized protein n=1 Tax=Leucocoprinus birnbaumii TaxID=56174 RepID=A0AAD5VYL3_9AGAR|nr:hypothetical protein NP233_g2328 [Leucocoprinus birnbaumii]
MPRATISIRDALPALLIILGLRPEKYGLFPSVDPKYISDNGLFDTQSPRPMTYRNILSLMSALIALLDEDEIREALSEVLSSISKDPGLSNALQLPILDMEAFVTPLVKFSSHRDLKRHSMANDFRHLILDSLPQLETEGTWHDDRPKAATRIERILKRIRRLKEKIKVLVEELSSTSPFYSSRPFVTKVRRQFSTSSE